VTCAGCKQEIDATDKSRAYLILDLLPAMEFGEDDRYPLRFHDWRCLKIHVLTELTTALTRQAGVR